MNMFQQHIIGRETVSGAVDRSPKSTPLLMEKSQIGTLRKPEASCIHLY
jgi:hypothetical protein